MRVTIREPKDKDRDEPTMELWIEQVDNGSVLLKGIDGNENVWCILTIRSDGTIYRWRSIQAESGWPLDDEGRVELSRIM